MSNNYSRLQSESELAYIWRLHFEVEKGNITWKELADYVNHEFRESEELYRDESAYRKGCQAAQKYYDEVFSKQAGNEYSEDIRNQRRELEIAKVQFRDERNEWNRQNRTEARVGQKLDYLESQLSEIGKVNFPVIERPTVDGDTELIVVVSDTHIGETNNNFFGSYSSEIAQDRLSKYLAEIREIQSRHKAKNVKVVLLGDLITGNIHLTIQVTNRENVIEQVKTVSELLSSFVYALSQTFETVTVASVSGNHSRITKKDDAVKDERLDDLVMFIMQKTLSHNNRIVFDTYANIDTGLAVIDVLGKDYVLVHGDYDTPTEQGIMRLCSVLGTFPEGVIMGHRHSPAYAEINGVKVIQSGCLSGSGGDYCVQKRLKGNPNQTVIVCNEQGIQCTYNVDLQIYRNKNKN